MNSNNLSLQAEAAGCVARVEGMKARNAEDAIRGEYPTYDEGSFRAEADHLVLISQAVTHD